MFYADWRAVPESTWPWRNFSAHEMRCRATGSILVIPEFMDWLQSVREACGFPLPVTSGYRSPEHNNRVSTTGLTGPHTTGMSADVSLYGERAHTLVKTALRLNVRGLGIKQKGPLGGRFIHLDLVGRDRVWSY